MLPLVLASTRAGRRDLLARLGLPFSVCVPPYDERPVRGLTPEQLALHHARSKALSLVARYPGQVVIGADPVATVAGERLGKPGTAARAEEQLQHMAGRWVTFHTGLAVVCDYTALIGLPLIALTRLLGNLGVTCWRNPLCRGFSCSGNGA